jgi:hypothetical protein
VLNAFQEDLKVIGMEINSYKRYMIHLPRMQGRKQTRELERDLQNAINRLPQKTKIRVGTTDVSHQDNGALEQHELSSETSLTT